MIQTQPVARSVVIYATNDSNPATGYGKMELGILRGLQGLGVNAGDPDAPLGLVTGSPAWGYIYGHGKRLWSYTMSEADRVSAEWVAALNHRYERCLVPSPELVTVYRESGVTIPIDYVPLGVDFTRIEYVQRDPDAAKNATPEQPFTFLTYSLGEMRKGADLAMMAFNRLFAGDMRYRMIVKCRDNPMWLAGLEDPQIELARGEMPEQEWHALMARCHAFIFPSRGEGFGLPPREATLSGLPTVATQWLGMWDVAQWGCALPVKELRPAQFDYWDANARGSRWAEPDKDILDVWMKLLVEDYPKYLALARDAGRPYLLEGFTWEETARSIVRLLDEPVKQHPITISTKPVVAMVLGSLNPGGGETQTCRLAVQLKQRGVEPIIILPAGTGEMGHALADYLNQQHIPFAAFRSPEGALKTLENVLEAVKPDALFACGYPLALLAMLAGYKTGVKTRILKFVSEGFERLEFLTDWWQEFAGLKAATHLVGNSQAVANAASQYYGAEGQAIGVIHNGVDIPELTPALRAEARAYWGLKDDEIAIGLLANFRADGIKNQMMLVKAAAQVVKSHPNAVFILAGYHTDYAQIVANEIARLGLGERVRIPGRLDDLRMLAGWDIAVNCSTTEGFSNAVQECMAYGLPVVATRVGGNPELVTLGTGVLVRSGDDDDMATWISVLIDVPELRLIWGENARQAMIARCRWDVIAEKWLTLLGVKI